MKDFLSKIKKEIASVVSKAAGVDVSVEMIAPPPDPKLGDFTLPCFSFAKIMKMSPGEAAVKIHAVLKPWGMVARIELAGPYINFSLDRERAAADILKDIAKEGKDYGAFNAGKRKKVMVEFAHPNTHKAFHIGHLRNIITGESIVRILENAGHKVIRANYQGDVGMHIAKCLWGIERHAEEYKQVKKEDIATRVRFLGKVYAFGAQAFEEDESAKASIQEINEKIYSGDRSMREVYAKTRGWSLEYFDAIYKRVGSRFDRLYFESEVFEDGIKIVKKFLGKGVFEESEGAVIFPGEKYGLHNRVFLNSKGLPTYEAKDIALAHRQFKEYGPEQVIHVVGKEQTEYFKVVFQALEKVLPKSAGKEKHVDYGWVTLESGKMSAREGKVVLGEWLLDEVEKKIAERTQKLSGKEKELAVKAVALAAVKYAMLHTGVKNDIVFDLEKSISITGSSGPYLLYIVTRIKSILKKFKGKIGKSAVPSSVGMGEWNLALQLGKWPEIARIAFEELDPSGIAQYLFEFAKVFNAFYENYPVLQAEAAERNFRLRVIGVTEQVMTRGLALLGIEVVERM